MSTESPLQILKRLFVNRTDCYCIQLSTGGYSKIPEVLTDQKLQEHLDGTTTIGTYQLDTNSMVKWFCYDLDPEKLENPQATAKKILDVIRLRREDQDGGKQPLVWDHAIVLEASRYPDNSYHIWVLFQFPVKAKVARWIALRILEIAQLNPKQIEVFPKQNEVTPERPYGNFVKLPFGKHQVEQKFSRLLDLDSFEPLALTELEEKHGLSLSSEDTAEMERMQTKTNVQMSFNVPATTRDITEKDASRLIGFLSKYWVKGYRNELVLSFCGMAIKEGKTHQSTRNIISQVCDNTATSTEDKVEFLAKVDYQFHNRKSLGNLKGISGIYEVIQAINQKQGLDETVEVPAC